jgi:UDP-N-acetylmuramyl pentapeptide phosphotransferase/UDP-N-acetylglucosamine-1-phosphate transferase
VSVLLAAGVALGVSAVVAEWFRRWAIGRRVLDVPNARSSHATPRPVGGGVGIVLGFLAGLAVWITSGGVFSTRAVGGLVGALVIATVSFVDDLRPLPAWLRLGVHLLATALLTVAGVQGGDVSLALTIPIAFAWIVLVTNIYNFMDGIDGLAATQAVIAGVAFGLAGAMVGNQLVGAAGPLLAAAAAGFLVHNLPPARLFMGDVGSTFLGFSFAGLVLLANLGVGGERLPLLFGVVVLAPFLFDGLVTLGRRILRHERWFEAHRSHYYQRMTQAGLGHGRVTLLYAALACVAAGLALTTVLVEPPLAQLLALLAYLPMLAVAVVVARLERARRPSVPYVSQQS